MKTTCFFVSLISVGVLLAAPPPAALAQAISADSSGNLREDSTLNLAGPRIVGVLPPAHLGTGTPSSATVLRGDGSWASTTPSGATIASSQSLLMGDGAGNAVPTSGSADFQRVLQLRADTSRALTSLPDNLLGSANLVLRGGTINADGTLTIPANDYLQWNSPGDPPNGVHYCYAVATTDVPVASAAGGTGVYITAYYNGYGSLPFGVPNGNIEVTTPAPGVSKYRFTNISNGGYGIFVVNATSAPVTIYPPVMTLGSDAGVLPVHSFADAVPVASQPVADLDFTRFATADRTARCLAEKQTTLAADSINGSAGNAGGLYAPKLTLQQTVSDGGVFGLYRGSAFRESLPLSTLGTSHGIMVQDIALGSEKALPSVSALDPVTTFTNNGDGTYSCLWTPTDGTVANDGYQNVYVVEINTTTESATPVASRHRLIDVSDLATVGTTPGSAWVQPPGTGAGQSGSATQWKATLRPTSVNTGSAGPPAGGYPNPGNGWYRYEVVSRYGPANWGAPTNPGDGAMSGLELVGGSWGYGSLGSPVNFVGDRLAILHCTTHNAVLGGGSLQRSLFYEMGDSQSIQLAWYTSNPAGLAWSTNHCLFYANVGDRPAGFLISHSGNGQNYDRGDVADCAFSAARWSDGSLHGFGFAYHNVNQGVIDRVYLTGVADVFDNFGNCAAGVEVKNSVFRQVGRMFVPGSFHDNVVELESVSDPLVNGNRGPAACVFASDNRAVTNNLLYLKWSGTTGLNGDNGGTFFNQQSGVTGGTATRNIVILGGTSGTANYATLQTGADSAAILDDNLVIYLGGDFRIFGGGGNCNNWADYRAVHPSLDPHSLFVDLSSDPRGLKAVFADPDHGDFRWAQTDVARRCAAYCQAHNVGPAAVTSRWPVVPTVDEAVRLLTDL